MKNCQCNLEVKNFNYAEDDGPNFTLKDVKPADLPNPPSFGARC